jgi:transcriptional regulator with XRE-family HTH domain
VNKLKARIKALCAQNGISQKFVSESTGHGQYFLNDVWQGKRAMSAGDFELAANALRTTPAYLRGETDDPETRVSQVIWPDKIQKSPAKLAMANKLLEMSEGDAQIYVGLYNMDIESINSIRQLLDAFKRQNGERP